MCPGTDIKRGISDAVMGADRDPSTGVCCLSQEEPQVHLRLLLVEGLEIGSGRSDPVGCCTWLGGDCRMEKSFFFPLT